MLYRCSRLINVFYGTQKSNNIGLRLQRNSERWESTSDSDYRFIFGGYRSSWRLFIQRPFIRQLTTALHEDDWVRVLNRLRNGGIENERNSYVADCTAASYFRARSCNACRKLSHFVDEFVVVDVLPSDRFFASMFCILSCFPPFSSIPHTTLISGTHL